MHTPGRLISNRDFPLGPPVAKELPQRRSLSPGIYVRKMRADVYNETAIYTPVSEDGISWARWLLTRRYNAFDPTISSPRITRVSLAKLYATTTVAANAQNPGCDGAQATPADVSVLTAAGVYTGTWAAEATVVSQTNIRYSTVVGDKVEYTIVLAQTAALLALRSIDLTANAGIGFVTILQGGVEVASSYYLPALTGAEPRVNLRQGWEIGVLYPLAKGLPAGTYTVRLTVSSANGASQRLYVGGLRAFYAAPATTLGRYGTANNRVFSTETIPTMFLPGAVSLYQFTGDRVAWRHATVNSGGQARVTVYNAAGVEISAGFYKITANTIDTYNVASVLVQTLVAEGFPYGTYYLKVEALTSRNASSTGWRIYDRGVNAYNMSIGGTAGTDSFDDLGVTDTSVSSGVPQVFIGTGNLEQAIKCCRTTDAVMSADFVCGIHGKENTTGIIYKLNGSVIDWTAAAVDATWQGETFGVEITAQVYYAPAPAAEPWATIVYEFTFSTGQCEVRTIRTSTAPAVVSEDYVTMLNVPNRAAGSQGLAGGFDTVEVYPDTELERQYPSVLDGNNPLPEQAKVVAFKNTDFVVTDEHLNWSDAIAAYPTGTAARSFIQTRTDKFIKHYNRGAIDVSTTLASGHQLRTHKRYRLGLRSP